MITTNFDYESCVQASERVAWKLDDVFPPDKKLDYGLRFLPDAITGVDKLGFLAPEEKLKLNQITGNSYLYLFYFVEEYIVASVVQHAHGEMFGNPSALRALLRFADEEVKHQRLFMRFRGAFESTFGTPCDVIENPAAVAEVILSKSPMAVLLVTLHLELVTQQHYVEAIRDAKGLDPHFVSLLKNHWVEESQHAKIDALELQKLSTGAPPAQIEKAVDDYLFILQAFAGLLAQQGAHDATSLARATGRTFSEEERKAIADAQAHAYRYALITLGVQNRSFQKYLTEFSEAGQARVNAQVQASS